ncbi:MAG TPA: CoB--CoM heterodisulfide reductase iron-sulfur subunit B family protein [Candidatus Binatus sp.]|nr:CoB--CoM heterodisulfide reductase iron-sulfur subunit B family protein [Candidatus Binatus sp.]
MSSYLYYPGCSMDGTGRAYAASLGVVAAELELELHEVDDWNCCGAFEYFAVSQARAYALVSRNLALAERQAPGRPTLLAACSACFLNLAKTDHQLRRDAVLSARTNQALAAGGLHYTPGSVDVRHLFEVLFRDVGIEEIGRHVTQPLEGLRVAPYLGCLVTRPDSDGRWTAREQPLAFDRLLAVLGAEAVDFPLRTACCGGHMSQISPQTGFELMGRLLEAATRSGADLIATVCPMCQMNLDVYQAELNRHLGTSYRMPILFFTQLLGLAFGEAPEKLGIGLELVSAREALEGIGRGPTPEAGSSAPEATSSVTTAQPPAPAHLTRRPRRASGLPMPVARTSDDLAPTPAGTGVRAAR